MNRERVERVAQLVRHAAREQKNRRRALVLDARLGGVLLFRDIGEDHREPPRRIARLAEKRHHVKPHRARLGISQLKLPRHDRMRRRRRGVVERRAERRPQPRHQPPQRLPREIVVTEPDQPVRGGVGIFDRAVVAHDEDALLERVENLLEQPALARQPLHEIGEVDGVERVEPSEHAVERGVFLAGHRAGL